MDLTTLDELEALRAARRATHEMPAIVALALDREADVVSVPRAAWRELRGAPHGLPALRAIHRAVSGAQRAVRRADAAGEWTLAPARPGHLRSVAQSLRIGDFVTPAWEPGTLRARLAQTLRESGPPAEPILGAASRAWTLVRAQPFAGSNERVALVSAALQLTAAGLPVIAVRAVEQDPAFADTLAQPDASALARLLRDAVWTEALAAMEWLALPRRPEQSLAAVHAEYVAARARARGLSHDELVALAEVAVSPGAELLADALGVPPSAVQCEITAVDAWAERLRAAIRGARHGRHQTPHGPMLDVRWSVAGADLEAHLMIGHVAHGITGAVSAYVVIGPADEWGDTPAPGFLALVDEPAASRYRRLERWLQAIIRGGRQGTA